MRAAAVVFFMSLMCITKAQEPSIIPKPVQTSWQPGSFIISSKTVLVLSNENEKHSADFLNEYLQQFYGFTLKIGKRPFTNYISLSEKKIIPQTTRTVPIR